MIKLKAFRKQIRKKLEFTILNPIFIERYYLKKALIKAKPYFNGTLIDIGCGDKPYANFIEKFVANYYGLEIETTFTELKNVEFVSKNHFKYPFEENSIDSVLLSQVLEHTYEPKKVLKEVNRILKPKCYLIGTAPQTNPIHEEPYDFFRYTPFSLKKMLEDTNFEVITINPTSSFGEMIFQILNAGIGRKIQFRKTFFGYLFFSILLMPFIILINLLGISIGSLIIDQKETLDYIFIARKI